MRRRTSPAAASGWSFRLWLLIAAGVLMALALAWPGPSVEVLWLRAGQPLPWLQPVALAAGLWVVRAAPSALHAAWRGWWLGTAWLVATFWWLFISMNTYGGLPAPLAALAVWALAAFLAIYYAAGLTLWWHWRDAGAWVQAAVAAAVWTLAELARGVWFTGFPWGALGYAQVDSLAALAPWVGVHGMGAAVVVGACFLMALGTSHWRGALLGLTVLGVVAIAAQPHRPQDHTRAAGGFRTVLLQGNIAQEEKFQGGSGLPLALSWYAEQITQALARHAGSPVLVVAPETAVPQLPQQQPLQYWRPLWESVAGSQGAVLLGLPLGSFEAGYTNSVWGWTAPTAAQALKASAHLPVHEDPPAPALQAHYRYDKHHLVPFGEFIPPGFRWFVDLMNIPLGDFARGSLAQAPLAWAGQRLAPHVCYEDLFGEELAAGFRDDARAPTVLVNVSNIAWFGNTVAIDQHRQISRLRALELGRPVLRATNTGATAVIDHLGQVTHEWPRLTRGVLEAEVQARTGLTPYARWASRWQLWPVWGVALAVLLGATLLRPRPRRLRLR